MKSLFFLRHVTALLLALTAGIALADTQPAPLVDQTANQVRTILAQENGKNTDAIREQVSQTIDPRFDFTRMTALAVGLYWKQATPAQKTTLAAEFRTLLTHTYFSTMLRYRDARITVKPDVAFENEGKQATVKTEVDIGNGKAPVAIDYLLYNTDSGWKVFSVNVEGASLVTVYRNQFAEEVNKGGIDGLIHSLQTKNARLVQGDTSNT